MSIPFLFLLSGTAFSFEVTTELSAKPQSLLFPVDRVGFISAGQEPAMLALQRSVYSQLVNEVSGPFTDFG